MNGSNYYDELTPDVTSYDYDAVLTEAGDFTEKYEKYRQVIGKYTQLPQVDFTSDIRKKAYGTLKVQEKVGLFEVLEDISTPVKTPSRFPWRSWIRATAIYCTARLWNGSRIWKNPSLGRQ